MSLLVKNNLFTASMLDSIVALPAVEEARARLEGRASGSVYFSLDVTSEMKAVLCEELGLDLHGVDSIPFRWIKGDTAAHIDTGAAQFEKTYLMYLTDSNGSLILGEESYPIRRGSAYVFPEGIRHETVGTGAEPRLLLGPMSESGSAVGGATTIIASGQTDIIYFKYITGSGLFYRINSGSDNTVSLPITIQNLTPLYTLKVLFETDITIESSITYFICGSDNIQFGSESLKEDGSRPIITIDSVLNYPGLIKNGGSGVAGKNNIYVFNLDIRSIGGSTLANGGGWVGQDYFGSAATGNSIVNCSSDGDISDIGGGIVGSGAASALTSGGSSLYIRGCTSSGTIGQYAGGIAGSSAGAGVNPSYPRGSIICDKCWSEGSIGDYGGGIFGTSSGQNNGTATATRCYSIGTIGNNGGGIFGEKAGDNTGIVNAINCYSRGNIQSNAGGIYGENGGINSGTAVATNCYSSGSIATPGNGIYGTGSSGSSSNCYAANGSWSDSAANLALTGDPNPVVGNTWVSTGLNQPYELAQMGYSPYTTSIINSSSELVDAYSQSIAAGSSSAAAIVSGKSYTILQMSPSEATIAINSTTGVISTTIATVPGTYTLYVRNTGSYNITTFTLTILPGGGSAGTSGVSCCDRTLVLNNTYNEINATLIAGNTLIGGVRRGVMSYSDRIRLEMALASKR